MPRSERLREPLPDKWRDALVGESGLKDLVGARAALDLVIQALQRNLLDNPLTEPAAFAAAKELKKSGFPSIVLDSTGAFWLEVDTKVPGGTRRRWSTSLPTLKALKEEADLLGVDVQSMGRSKTAIIEAIKIARRNASEQEASKESPKRRMVKTFSVLNRVPLQTDPNVT